MSLTLFATSFMGCSRQESQPKRNLDVENLEAELRSHSDESTLLESSTQPESFELPEPSTDIISSAAANTAPTSEQMTSESPTIVQQQTEREEAKETVLASSRLASLESEAIEVYRQFVDLAEPILMNQNLAKTDEEVQEYIRTVVAMDACLQKEQELAEGAPSSALIHELLGETAFQFADIQETLSKMEKVSVPLAKSTIAAKSQLKSIAQNAFQQSLVLDSGRSNPHDRLARIRFATTRDYSDLELARHLIASINNNPNSPQSICLLILVLTMSDLLQSSSNYQVVHRTLMSTRGEARKELKKGHEFVKNELKELMNLSRQIAENGFIDRSVQREFNKLTELHALLQGLISPGTFSIVTPD